MRAQLDARWILAELEGRLGEFTVPSNVCPFEADTHGFTVTAAHGFAYVRKRSRAGVEKESLLEEKHRLYLHFFQNRRNIVLSSFLSAQAAL